MKTLSVCMITKNEEKNIARCLKSIVDIADEIIVADTGSTDNTVEIALSYGAKVINHPWNYDFSDARNASLEDATKDWILFLDADEEMTSTECTKLKQLINMDYNYEGYYLRLVNIIDNLDIGDSVVLRMFKNDSRYRFRGKMHEQVVNSIQEIHGLNCIGQTDIRILHYGYDPKISDVDVKHKRNIDLLNSYDEKDKDGYYYYVLGNEYARVNNFEKAHEIYNKALKVTDLKYKYIYYPYLILNISKIYSNDKKFGQQIKFIESIKHTTPQFKDLYFLETMSYIECCKYTKALQALNTYLNCPQGYSYEYPNNNFENCYNIPELKRQLESAVINHDEEKLSGLILINKDNITKMDELIDTIKTINEITTNVVVVVDNDPEINIDQERIRSVCAQIIFTNQPNKKLSVGMKNCKGKYVIIMKPGEICSQQSQKELAQLLLKPNKDAFNLIVLNMFNGEYNMEARIIKNNKKAISVEASNKNNYNSKQAVNIPIYIHNKII